jgi:hypothetical protein
MSEDERRIEYIPLAELLTRLHPRNPKDHDISAIVASYKYHGFVASGVIDSRTGLFLAGHGRIKALARMKQQGMEAPNGIRNGGADWLVPVQTGYESESDDAALAYLANDNRLTELGGWDEPALAELLQEIHNSGEIALEASGFDADDLDTLLNDLGMMGSFEIDKEAKPNPRNLPIDVIYTLQMADCTCCLAVQAGLSYGIQSSQYRICPYCGQLSGRHKVQFIDNDYFNYDHQKHLSVVKEFKPKYATVMDIMTSAQCKKDNIEWHSLGQILDWAEELNEHAENVIVIPKYDCLDQIPEKFMLGYSVPTSHGGTPLPPEAFSGRRAHLLGGSWKAQLAHMAVLGDDVVSLDTNYVQRQASLLGAYCNPNGEQNQMQDIGFSYLTNVRYAALSLSFGAIGAKINELYPQAVEVPAINQNIKEHINE